MNISIENHCEDQSASPLIANSPRNVGVRQGSGPRKSANTHPPIHTQRNEVELISSACLYIACKSEEEQHVHLRDIINVAYRTLHRDKPPLEMGETYSCYRESILNCELYILRSLQFKAVVYHPHKFLLHYLKFIRDWFDPSTWESVPITRTCWSILRDSYHSNLALRYRPQHIAIAIIYFAFLSHGLEVPHSKTADLAWWKVFKEDLSLNEIKDIINEIVYTYEMENTLHSS